MDENKIINAFAHLQNEDESSSISDMSIADQDQNDGLDTGDNLTTGTQVATTGELTGTTLDNITADEKLDNEENARVQEDETKTMVHIVNSAMDSAVVEEGDEQKALLYGPAILSGHLPLQQEVDGDNNPSRPAGRGNTHRRSSSADNRDQVPSGQLGPPPISDNIMRDDRREQRARNKQRKVEELEQQQLDDRVRQGQEEATFALREDEEEQQRLRDDELRAVEVKREVDRRRALEEQANKAREPASSPRKALVQEKAKYFTAQLSSMRVQTVRQNS
jgi:hypothetical protein